MHRVPIGQTTEQAWLDPELSGLHLDTPPDTTYKKTRQLTTMKFDFIIAGGGTSGLLLANRLSANPSTTVVIIEPGQDVRTNPNVSDPAKFLGEAAFDTSIDWAYLTTPQPHAAGRTLELHAGKAVGGISTINGMTYIRADAAEIDAWAALESEGWSWESLLPYYRRVESFSPPTVAQTAASASYEAQFHGAEEFLKVGNLYTLPNGSFHGIVRDTWEGLGYAVNPEVNSGDTRGFDVWPMTVDGFEVRCGQGVLLPRAESDESEVAARNCCQVGLGGA